MNIGIDFDGVVFDSEKMFRAYSQIFNLKIDGDEMINIKELKAQKRYGWNSGQFEKFLDGCLMDILQNAPIMPCAEKVLNAIAKKHKIYAITARGCLDKREIDVTEERLKKENLPIEKVFYTSNKLDICKEYNIELFIDDLCDNIKELAQNGIKCLYFRDYILFDCKHPNVTEVHNWGDVAVELCKMGIIDKEDID